MREGTYARIESGFDVPPQDWFKLGPVIGPILFSGTPYLYFTLLVEGALRYETVWLLDGGEARGIVAQARAGADVVVTWRRLASSVRCTRSAGLAGRNVQSSPWR